MSTNNNNKQHFKVCFCWSRGFKLRGGEIPEDIKQVFESYSVYGIMSIDNLISFLEKEQKEVNNVTKEAQNIFNSLKHHHNIVHKRGLNLDAFFKYLIGDYNFAHQSKVLKLSLSISPLDTNFYCSSLLSAYCWLFRSTKIWMLRWLIILYTLDITLT